MRRMMQLPELFAGLRLCAALLASALLRRSAMLCAVLLLLLFAVLAYAGWRIGIKGDMLTYRGRRICFAADMVSLAAVLAALIFSCIS